MSLRHGIHFGRERWFLHLSRSVSGRFCRVTKIYFYGSLVEPNADRPAGLLLAHRSRTFLSTCYHLRLFFLYRSSVRVASIEVLQSRLRVTHNWSQRSGTRKRNGIRADNRPYGFLRFGSEPVHWVCTTDWFHCRQA